MSYHRKARDSFSATYSAGHTISGAALGGEAASSLHPSTKLSDFFVFFPITAPTAASFTASDGEVVNLFALFALYPEELTYTIAHGSDALIDRMEAADIDDLFDPVRSPVVEERAP